VACLVLPVAVLLLRRPPVLLVLARPLGLRLRDTVFLGWFGPIAVSALLYLTFAEDEGVIDPRLWAAEASSSPPAPSPTASPPPRSPPVPQGRGERVEPYRRAALAGGLASTSLPIRADALGGGPRRGRQCRQLAEGAMVDVRRPPLGVGR
jgi:hypothetical protein